METITIPGGKKTDGTITAISSKSDLHRLIICGCLSQGKCEIAFEARLSKDITATIACLSAMGAEIAVSDGVISIKRPIIAENIPENCVLDCGESGSTARFILPIASVLCKRGATLIGSGKLPERPFEPLCVCLESKGAKFSSHKLPITIERTTSLGGFYEIPGNVSSQYISGLLFTLPICSANGVKLTTELESGGYVSLTSDAMKRFGVNISFSNGIYSASGAYSSPTGIITAQGDWSNSAFWLCSASEGHDVTVTGLDLESSQPDRQICGILSLMGFDVRFGENSVTVGVRKKIHGVSFNAKNIPDIAPILAVRAAVAFGDTVITGIERLRIKESDRVSAVCDLINALGGSASADEHSIKISGVERFSAGAVDSFNDHRIAMSAAIAACFANGDVTIHDCRAVEKSYPQFYEHYEKMTSTELSQIYND